MGGKGRPGVVCGAAGSSCRSASAAGIVRVVALSTVCIEVLMDM